jgi:hypothetical protein
MKTHFTATISGLAGPALFARTILIGLVLLLGRAHAQGFVAAPTSPFATGTNPNDLATADVNADGHLDLVTANNFGDNVTVLLGTGTGSFAPAAGSPFLFSAGSGPTCVAIGDVNADSRPDLLVGTTTIGLVVLLGNGTGGFAPAAGSPFFIATSVYPQDLALGDMNEDGHLDVISGNYSAAGVDNVAILLGTGTGSFALTPDSPFSTGLNHISYGVAVGDLNGDGHLDLTTANYASNSVSVALGDGTAFFPLFSTITYPTTGNGGFVYSIALGDANGDGRLDIVATNTNRDEVALLLNSGTGTFAMAPNAPFFMGLNNSPVAAQLRDMDGDNRADLVIVNSFARKLVVLLNNGAGNFLPAPGSPYSMGNNFPGPLAVGDVDEDGRPDIATANGNTNSVTVLLNRLVQPLLITALAPARNALTAAPATAVGITFNRAVNAATASNVRVFSARYRGQRTTTTTTTGGTISLAPSPNGGSGSAAFRPGETLQVSVPATVQATNGGPAVPQVYQFTTAAGGTGKGIFTVPAQGTVPVGTTPNAVALADLDGDGDLDMLTANDVDFNGSDVSLRFNDGTGSFAPPAVAATGTVAVGALARSLAVGDVDGDGDLDFVTGNESSDNVSLRLNNGAGVFGLPAVAANGTIAVGNTPSGGPAGVALGDVDGDGDLDLVCALFRENAVSLRLNNGAGVFGPPTVVANGSVAVGTSPRGPALADVDGDGDLDLLVANTNGSSVSVRLNNGVGAFAPPAVAAHGTVVVGNIPWRVTVGDVDGDGDLDFITPNPFDGTASLRLNDGTGIFTEPAVAANGTLTVGNAYAASLADVDADGDLDLLTPDGTNHTVQVARNNGAGVFAAATAGRVAVGVIPFDLALGDVDNDGDLDLVTANNAPNTASVRLNGPAPDISVTLNGVDFPSGSTYDFGTVPLRTVTPTLVFHISNAEPTGLLSLTTLGVTRSAGTSISYGGSGFPYAVAGTTFASLDFDMRPLVSGQQTARLVINSDDPDEPAYVLNFVVNQPAPTAVTWTGAVSTDWNTASNWSPAVVPTDSTDALIAPAVRQPIVTTAAATCANLTVQASATLTIAALPTAGYLKVGKTALVVGGGLPTDGRLLMSGGTLEVKGDLLPNGRFTTTGGLVTLTGPRRQRLGGNGSNYPIFWNLTVAGPADVFQINPISVQRVLTLQGNLLVNGTGLRLTSDASGTAMVVNAGGDIQGVGFMERYISGPNAGRGYRHFSSPMLASGFPTVGDLATAGFGPVVNPAYNTTGNTAQPFPTVFRFDEARQGAAGVPGPVGFDQGWASPTALTELLAAGRGYTVNLPGTSKVALFGNFNNGPVAVAGGLSRSGTGAFAGYHLLGNPYPAPIDWDQVVKPAGLDNAVYVFRSTGQYTGAYDYYVNNIGTLTGGEIAAMQGFFVRVSQPVASFSFTNAARLTSYANPSFQRGPAETRPLLALALRPATSSAAADVAFVYLQAGATTGFDGYYDALKLPNPNGLSVATMLGADSYAVNGLPALAATPRLLPLALTVPAAGAYELAADQLLNFAPGTHIWLHDYQLGTRTLLAAGTRYAFTLAGTNAPGRFSIELRPGTVTATAAQDLAAQVSIFPNPAHRRCTLTLRPRTTATTGQLVNALGQQLRTFSIAPGQAETTVDLAALAAGVYALRLALADGQVVTQRVVLE